VWQAFDLPALPFISSRIEGVQISGQSIGPVETVAGGPMTAAAQPRFSPSGRQLAYCSDTTGRMQVHILDLESGTTTVVATPGEHAGPTWGNGARSFAWAPDEQAIAVNVNRDGFGSLVAVPLAALSEARTIADDWHYALHWNERGLVAGRMGPTTPHQLVHYPDGVLSGQVSAAQMSASFAMSTQGVTAAPVRPESVTWRRGDTEIHGLWWTPHSAAGQMPVLVMAHGGPTDQAQADWDARRIFFLEQGWAIFAPNPRGSTGYGRDYALSLRGAWGIEDLEDVAEGIRTVVPARNGDASRVAIMGASAGGFLALRMAIAHPELIRAAVSVFGVTDLGQMLHVAPPREIAYVSWLVGDDPDSYVDRSPARTADRIAVPLLLLQGDRDVLVPRSQHDAMLVALRAAGTPVEHHLYVDEGHGWAKPTTVADEVARVEAFLARRVLGRDATIGPLGW
jgi:dipeptidyl aminopeptidase/acylaminoacyl peptidase